MDIHTYEGNRTGVYAQVEDREVSTLHRIGCNGLAYKQTEAGHALKPLNTKNKCPVKIYRIMKKASAYEVSQLHVQVTSAMD